LTEAENGAPATEEQLKQALDATSKRLRRLVGRLRETDDLDEDMAKEVKRSKRQLRENRELLGIAPRGDSEGAAAEE
jgi:hypothetical protein